MVSASPMVCLTPASGLRAMLLLFQKEFNAGTKHLGKEERISLYFYALI